MPDSKKSKRLFVIDRNTGQHFLIDTGADISIIPATTKDIKQNNVEGTLFAANGSPINVYGNKVIKLNLNLRREFMWTFRIAKVNAAIIGADFLQHFQLSVDLAEGRLTDNATNLNTEGTKLSSSIPTIKVINKNDKF